MSFDIPILPPIEAFTDAEALITEGNITPVEGYKVSEVFKAKKDLLTEIQSLRMTCDKVVPALTPILKLGESTVSTPGNITGLSGEGKSGKTAAAGAILAGAIAPGKYDGFANIDISINDKRLAVIHIETEQSESRHQVNHRTIVKRAGFETCTPAFFLSYNVRQMPLAE